MKELLFLWTNTFTSHSVGIYIYSVRQCSDEVTISPFVSKCFQVFIRKVIRNELQKENANFTNKPQTNTFDNNETKLNYLFLFSGKQDIQLLHEIGQKWKKSIASNAKTHITYETGKISAQFPVKDRTKFQHRDNSIF